MASERSARSAAEIAALPELGTTEFGAFVRTHGTTLSAETLVYIVRRVRAEPNTAMLGDCCRLLLGHETETGAVAGGHCEGIIVNLARYFGFSDVRETRHEFRRSCYMALWEEIGRDDGLLEYKFGLVFRGKCIDVAKSMIRAKRRSADTANAAEDDDGPVDVDGLTDEEAVTIEEAVLNRLARPIHQKVLLQALRRLTKRQAHAALLAWVERIPIDGKDARTVACIMEISPTAVHKLLRKARETLQADPAVRAIWFGEA